MGISEANSEGAAMRVSSKFDVSLDEQYEPGNPQTRGEQSLAQSQTSFSTSLFDWLPDYFKSGGSDSGQCLPSPLYDHAVGLARDLYHDRELAGKLNGYKNKFDCLIKTDEDAVKYANEALHVIGDPYTRVLSKKQADELKESITGDKQITGIGISIGLQKNEKTGGASYAVIGAVFPGTPADRAGLKPGDLIIQVGDQSTKDLSMEKIQALVRGQDGSKVQLKIDRDGTMMDVFAMRAKVEVPATLEQNFGDVQYIKLIDFMNDKTDTSVKQSILAHPHAKAFIVDLRGNPGGRVEEMIETIGLLMKDGPVFTEQTRTQSGVINKTIELTEQGVKLSANGASFSQTENRNRYLLNGRPLVVLVDEFSASASELLAGALKDNRKAVIIGSKTFGKGVGQQIIPIENGTMVAVTNTKFTNPGGNWSGDGNENRIGIEPNIQVPSEKGTVSLTLNDKQFQRALQEARRMAGTSVVEPPAQPLTPRVRQFDLSVPIFQRLQELERSRMPQGPNPGDPGVFRPPVDIYPPLSPVKPAVRKPYGD